MVLETSQRHFPRPLRLPRIKSTEEQIKELREKQKEEKIRKAFNRLDEVLDKGFLERTMVAPTKPDEILSEYEDTNEFLELFQVGDVTIARERYITRKGDRGDLISRVWDESTKSSKYYILKNNSLVTNEEEIISILKKITGLKFLALKYRSSGLSYSTYDKIVTEIDPYDKLENIDRKEFQPNERDVQEQISNAKKHLKECLADEFGYINIDVAIKNAGMLKGIIDQYKPQSA
jgi:hypothetical protein